MWGDPRTTFERRNDDGAARLDVGRPHRPPPPIGAKDRRLWQQLRSQSQGTHNSLFKYSGENMKLTQQHLRFA